MGGAYRFERGKDDYVEYNGVEWHDDKNDARESFAAKLAKREQKQDDRVISGANQSQGYEHDASDNDAAASVSVRLRQKQCPARSVTNPRPPSAAAAPPRGSSIPASWSVVDPDDAAQVAQEQEAAAELPLPKRGNASATTRFQAQDLPERSQRARALSRATATSRASSALSPAPSIFSLEIGSDAQCEDGQGNQIEGSADAGARRRRQDERDLDDARTCLQKAISDFGSDHHLDHSRQTQACSKSVDKLRRWARKLSKSSDSECKSESQSLFDYADEIEERQNLFEDAKNNFSGTVLSSVSKPRSAILRTMSNGTICQLISMVCHKASDDALCNELMGQALYKCLVGPCALRGHSAPGLGLHLCKGDAALVMSTQRPLLHNHLEKILKEPSLAALGNAAARFCGCLADMDINQIVESLDKVQAVADHPGDNDSRHDQALLNGWEPQLWADLVTVFTMGRVAQDLKDKNDGRISGQLFGLVKSVVNSRSKVSGRIRCYHKHIGGIAHTSRDIWRAMEAVAEKDCATASLTADQIIEWTTSLRRSRLESVDVTDLLVSLGEVICDEVASPKIKSQAEWLQFATESGDKSESHLMAATRTQSRAGGVCWQAHQRQWLS